VTTTGTAKSFFMYVLLFVRSRGYDAPTRSKEQEEVGGLSSSLSDVVFGDGERMVENCLMQLAQAVLESQNHYTSGSGLKGDKSRSSAVSERNLLVSPSHGKAQVCRHVRTVRYCVA
jgi:hypothetical protein